MTGPDAYLLRRDMRENGETPEKRKALKAKEKAIEVLVAQRDALREEERAQNAAKGEPGAYQGAGRIPDSVLEDPTPSNTAIAAAIRKMETRAVRLLN